MMTETNEPMAVGLTGDVPERVAHAQLPSQTIHDAGTVGLQLAQSVWFVDESTQQPQQGAGKGAGQHPRQPAAAHGEDAVAYVVVALPGRHVEAIGRVAPEAEAVILRRRVQDTAAARGVDGHAPVPGAKAVFGVIAGQEITGLGIPDLFTHGPRYQDA